MEKNGTGGQTKTKINLQLHKADCRLTSEILSPIVTGRKKSTTRKIAGPARVGGDKQQSQEKRARGKKEEGIESDLNGDTNTSAMTR